MVRAFLDVCFDPDIDIGPSLARVVVHVRRSYPVSHPYPRVTRIVATSPPFQSWWIAPLSHCKLMTYSRIIEIVQRLGAASDAVLGF